MSLFIKVNKFGQELQMQEILGLRPETCPLWDVVFVSLDLETREDDPQLASKNRIIEIGVSVLDTRNFSKERSGSLVTQHFVSGGHKKTIKDSQTISFRGVKAHQRGKY